MSKRQSSRISRQCEQCQTGFTVKPSAVAVGRGRFCSTACHDKFRERRVSRTCAWCETPFEVKPSELTHRPVTFCSYTCMGAARAAEPLSSRFARYCSLPTATGCILWTGALDWHGYGQLRLPTGPTARAHRVAWILTHGSVPDDRLVLHTCDTPACVAIAHLFLGTDATNSEDKVSKGRHRSPRITVTIAREITRMRATGDSPAVIATALNVALTIVCSVIKGRTWRDA